MPVRRPGTWWKRSRMAAFGTAAVVLGAGMFAASLAVTPGPFFIGLPILQFVAVILFPFIVAGIIGSHANWQETTDRACSVWEDD